MARRAEAIAERREPLSRELVLRAAIELADRDGVGALTMRNLARQLGVEAMSLYYYVERKEDLLASAADLVMREVQLPSGRSADWKSAVREMAISYHDTLRRHPWVHSVRMSPPRLGAGQLRYMEWLLGHLRRAGFSPRMTHHAYHILDSHITGSALWEMGITAAVAATSLPDLARRALASVPIAEYPYFHEHAQQHIGGLTKRDQHPFELGLDLILDGLDRMRGAESEPPRVKRRKRTASPRRRGA